MRTTLIGSDQKQGMPPTLYHSRLNFNEIKNVPSTLKLESQLLKIDRNIGFAHVTPKAPVVDDNYLTKYDVQLLGSLLSYHFPPMDIDFSILSNLDNLPDLYDNAMGEELPESLPVTTLD